MNKSIIDWDDLKVKHISGEYTKLPYSPEVDDIFYWCKTKKKKTFTTLDLKKSFGDEKGEIILKTMDVMISKDMVKILSEEIVPTDPKVKMWFYHPESESYFKDLWEKYNEENNDGVEHIGVVIDDENENEGVELHELRKRNGKVVDGLETIYKYEIINS